MSVPSCPLCKSANIRRSRTRLLREKFLKKFGWRVFRCRQMDCRWRGLIRTKPVDQSIKKDIVIGMVLMLVVVGIFVGHTKFYSNTITGTSVTSLGVKDTELAWEPDPHVFGEVKSMGSNPPKLTLNSRGEIQEKGVLTNTELRSQDKLSNEEPIQPIIDVYARIAALEREIEKLNRSKRN
jgi:hypothetical protein